MSERFTRRRFVQGLVGGTAGAPQAARWTVQAIAGALLAGCRSVRRFFTKPFRWVFPSAVGDFVIETADHVAKLQQFPFWIYAKRFEFPAVALTILEGAKQPTEPIDSDRALLHDVWVLLDAKTGAQLFREHDIVRSDLEARVRPKADFRLSFSPTGLFPPLHRSIPLTLDFADAPRSPNWRDRDYGRDKMLQIDFCVDPEACQGSGRVTSTVPVVTARWPEFYLVVQPAGGPAVAMRPAAALTVDTETPGACEPLSTNAHTLRTVVAKFHGQSLPLAVHTYAGGDTGIVVIDAAFWEVRIRAGFVDLKIPARSRVERRRNGAPVATSPLKESRLEAGTVHAYAWATAAPSTTTSLPVQYASRFCLFPDGNDPWALTPEPILRNSDTSTAVVHGISFGVNAQDVVVARFASLVRAVGEPRRETIVQMVEQELRNVTLTIDGRPLAISGAGTPLHYVIDNDEGRFWTDAATASATSMLLLGDLFVDPLELRDVNLRFQRTGDHYALAQGSTLSVRTKKVAWAGRLDPVQFAQSWVHLAPFTDPPDPARDYRAIESLATGNPAAPDDKAALIRWDPIRDRYDVLNTVPAPAATEIVSLSADAFRAAIPAAFPPPRGTRAVEFPPFALREHRDFDFGVWVNDTPAFPKSKNGERQPNLWEPRTAGAYDRATTSPSEIFRTIASADFSTFVNGRYAGFSIEGALQSLDRAPWAPRTAEGLAPYRAIAATALRPNEDAEDVVDLSDINRAQLQKGFQPDTFFPDRPESLQRLARDPQTEIAFSPIGGTIDYEWAFERPATGLLELVLRGYLGRYQKNYVIVADVLLPWGIRIFTLNLTSRQESGRLRYCNKWWFAEPYKEYGDKQNIRVTNLRPLNSVNYNAREPMLFQADIHYLNGEKRWIDPDRNLQGIRCATVHAFPNLTPALTQTVVLERPQPLTLFKDTPLRLQHVVWHTEPPPDDCPAVTPPITVTAHGELENVPGMHYDTRALSVSFTNVVDAASGMWDHPEKVHDDFPVYATNAVTLGDGVVRIDRPLRHQERWTLTGHDKHVFQKKIKAGDVGLLQLVLGGGGDAEFLENEGTLTIEEEIVVDEGGSSGSDQPTTRTSNTNAHVTADIDFPQFSRGTSEVCSGNLGFRMKVSPKSFHAHFKKELTGDAEFNAKLIADVGVPGFIVLKGCTMESSKGNPVSFTPGQFEICGELLRQVLEFLLEKVKKLMMPTGNSGGSGGSKGDGNSPFTFELLDRFLGFLVKFRLPLPRIPFGAGSLENLTFDVRLSLAIDISRSGIDTGSLMTFILGDYRRPAFGGFDWLHGDLVKFVDNIFRDLRPPTLTITPFTIRFSVSAAMRVKPASSGGGLSLPDPFRKTCFDAVVAISGEGGLAVAFDVGVANGGASITLGIVWRPYARYVFEASPSGVRGDQYFSFDEIGVFARIEAHASVLGIVNIFIRVELMAQLKLTCSKGILSHLEINGTATIEVGFLSYDVHFTVDLDPILGIDPNACPRDKFGPTQLCELPAAQPDELAHVAMHDFFSFAEVA